MEQPDPPDPNKKVACRQCRFSGPLSIWKRAGLTSSQIRCPQCGSTDNRHNSDQKSQAAAPSSGSPDSSSCGSTKTEAPVTDSASKNNDKPSPTPSTSNTGTTNCANQFLHHLRDTLILLGSGTWIADKTEHALNATEEDVTELRRQNTRLIETMKDRICNINTMTIKK